MGTGRLDKIYALFPNDFIKSEKAVITSQE